MKPTSPGNSERCRRAHERFDRAEGAEGVDQRRDRGRRASPVAQRAKRTSLPSMNARCASSSLFQALERAVPVEAHARAGDERAARVDDERRRQCRLRRWCRRGLGRRRCARCRRGSRLVLFARHAARANDEERGEAEALHAVRVLSQTGLPAVKTTSSTCTSARRRGRSRKRIPRPPCSLGAQRELGRAFAGAVRGVIRDVAAIAAVAHRVVRARLAGGLSSRGNCHRHSRLRRCKPSREPSHGSPLSWISGI